MTEEKWPGQSDPTRWGLAPRFYATPRGTEENPISDENIIPLTEQEKLEISKLYGPQYVIALEKVQENLKTMIFPIAVEKAVNETDDIIIFQLMNVLQDYQSKRVEEYE